MLIDLSSRMAARQTATALTIRDLAVTGIHGRMQEDETLTIWYYDNRFSTNMPPLAWDPDHAGEFADRVERSFKAKGYLKASRPKGPTITPAPKKTSFFTTMVFTDGYLPFQGTPFDAEINSSLSSFRERFAKEKKPFLVTLLAKNGEWVAYGVHTNLGASIELPFAPTNSIAVDKALAALREALTNPAPQTPVKVAEVPKPARVKVEEPPPPPKIETPPVVVAQKPVEEPPPKLVEQTVEKTVEKSVEPPIAKPVEKPVEKPAPVVIAEKTNIVVAKAIEPPPVEPPPRIEVEVPKPKTAPAPITAVVTAQSESSPWPLFLAGFGVIVALGGLAYIRFAPTTDPRGSLISQSLAAQRDKRPPQD